MNQYLVDSPYTPFTIKNQLKAIHNGKVYVGEVDKDPLNPSQQIQVYVVNESGANVPVSQPIELNAGGYLVYNGQVSKFVTLEAYSMVALNSVDVEMWRVDDVSKVDPDNLNHNSTKNRNAPGAHDAIYDRKFGAVSDMVTFANPESGSSFITMTYKGENKGGAYYNVVSKSDHDIIRGVSTVDEQWDHTLSNGLVALMQKNGTHALIEQAGVYPGEDPVQAIRTGVGSKYFKKIRLEAEAEYPVSASWPNVGGFPTPISLNGVYQSVVGEKTILQLEANDFSGYNIFSNTGIECEVGGLIIRGDKLTHTGVVGEFGMGVANRGSIKAYIHDLVIENCWGDGWYEGALGGGNSRTLGTRAENITVNNGRRNGWSLVSAKGLRAKNIELNDTSGTAPQAGLDIEPNTILDSLEDIIIDGLRTKNNVAGGVTLYLGGWSAAGTESKSMSITIRNHISEDEVFPFVCTRLFYEAGDSLLSGHLTMIDPVAIRSTDGGYFMRDWSATHSIDINLVRPKLIDCNTSKGTSSLNNAAFASYRLVGDLGEDTTQGGINIDSPVIEFTTNTVGPMSSLYVHNNYKVPTVPNYNTKGFVVKGRAKFLGAYSEAPPSFMQGSFDIDFPEVTLTQSQIVGLTASTAAAFGKFLLKSATDKTLTINPATYQTQPLEFLATSNNWKLSPSAGGRFILNGAYLAVNQQVRTSGSYGVVKFTAAFSENGRIQYLTANPSNGLVAV